MEKEEQQQEQQQEQETFITDIAQLEKEKEREREQELKKAEMRAKKRKLIPPFVMLLAGAIVSITMFVLHYKTKDMLVILLCVLLGFYVAGELLKWMLDRFEAQVMEARNDAGEFFEKDLEGHNRIVRTNVPEPEEENTGESVQVGRRDDDDEEELIF